MQVDLFPRNKHGSARTVARHDDERIAPELADVDDYNGAVARSSLQIAILGGTKEAMVTVESAYLRKTLPLLRIVEVSLPCRNTRCSRIVSRRLVISR